MEQPSSNLFEGYKSVGHVTGPLPCIVRHGKNLQDTRIVTVIGRTFHTYTTNLSLVEVSIPHEYNISVLISDERYIYSAAHKTIFQWGRGSKTLIQKLDHKGHGTITHMIKLGSIKLVAIDENNTLLCWNLKEKTLANQILFDEDQLKITALCHPHSYKDKCLIGSKSGKLELWNVASETCLYTFKGWDSSVTCLAQSPVDDVIAIGLDDGHIYIHNIKFDELVMKIFQDYGSVTSMSFRLDTKPYLVTACAVGHLMVWNLERKRLSAQVRNAHCNHISKCQFIKNECLMVSSGSDNALKVWSMDMSDGGGTLLSQRAGHSEPPSFIEFYGPKSFNLLSAGLDSTIKMFHLFSERLNRNLGTARWNAKSKHAKQQDKDKQSTNRLPPITCFAAETAKEKQWDNIVACHRNTSLVTTWNYDKCKMGEHIIQQPTFNKHEVFASCICLTKCGNFIVIGFSNGLIFKYNIQSGLFRQYFECPTLTDRRAHEGQVTSVTVDGLDLVLVSGGVDSTLRLWSFKSGSMLMENKLQAPIKKLKLHQENNLIAVALDNETILIFDLETRSLVRQFNTAANILDMTLSPDSRWLIASLDDKSIRTWDLQLGKMIDAFSLSSACISLSMCSTGEFLATAHENSLGVNIWCNYTIYCPSLLRPIDESKSPPRLDMPFVRCDEPDKEDMENDELAVAEVLEEPPVEITYMSPEQLNENVITLSGLPSSRWKNLLNIEEIREKQRIDEEQSRERQIRVPFFIPVKDGLQPTLDTETVKEMNSLEGDGPSRVTRSKISELRLLSPLVQCLVDCGNKNDFSEFLSQLKALGPSATDAEIRSLGKDTCGDIQPILCFLDAIEHNIKRKLDYEITSSWLALLLRAHSDLIQTDAKVGKRCSELSNSIKDNWNRLSEEFNQIFCVLNFVRSSIL